MRFPSGLEETAVGAGGKVSSGADGSGVREGTRSPRQNRAVPGSSALGTLEGLSLTGPRGREEPAKDTGQPRGRPTQPTDRRAGEAGAGTRRLRVRRCVRGTGRSAEAEPREQG